ncbi:replication protein RepA [Sphingomonas sp. 179-A 4D3 NHS]|jgi:hypothetical protein|uniref:replication protein RepA n=1 Tax=Sphingomonas sp. 179-A 4D3 NHS TaxID=3374291 RepID=UPI00387945B3
MSREPTAIGAVTADLFASIERQQNKRTPRDLALIERGLEIAARRPEGDEVTFMHSTLCAVGMPRSKVEGDTFSRINGNAAIELRAGKLWNGKAMVKQPLPYGPIPRLILAYVSAYAVRENTPEIPFGDSANDALRLLGIEKSGQGFRMFRTQLQALAACQMTIGFTSGDIASTFDGSPVEQFDAWLPGKEGQRSLWPSRLILGRRFFETLRDHAVPIDLEALSALRSSALAMDVYLFLVQRLYRIGAPLTLNWWLLKDQFGQEYVGADALADFKKKFRKALAQALSVYPGANVEVVRGGVTFRKSAPAVDPVTAKRLRAA